MIYLVLSIVSLVLCVVSGYLIVVGNAVLVNKPWEKVDGFWSEQLATNVRNTSIVLLVVFIVLAIFFLFIIVVLYFIILLFHSRDGFCDNICYGRYFSYIGWDDQLSSFTICDFR